MSREVVANLRQRIRTAHRRGWSIVRIEVSLEDALNSDIPLDANTLYGIPMTIGETSVLYLGVKL